MPIASVVSVHGTRAEAPRLFQSKRVCESALLHDDGFEQDTRVHRLCLGDYDYCDSVMLMRSVVNWHRPSVTLSTVRHTLFVFFV